MVWYRNEQPGTKLGTKLGYRAKRSLVYQMAGEGAHNQAIPPVHIHNLLQLSLLCNAATHSQPVKKKGVTYPFISFSRLTQGCKRTAKHLILIRKERKKKGNHNQEKQGKNDVRLSCPFLLVLDDTQMPHGLLTNFFFLLLRGREGRRGRKGRR